MLTLVYLRDKIFSYLKTAGYDCKISKIYDEDINHIDLIFNIKQFKHYKFGMQLYTNCIENDTFKEPDNYNIYLYGEHKDYIDKFKPTATKISRKITVDNDCFKLISKNWLFGEYNPLTDQLFEFYWDLQKLKSGIFGKWYFYGPHMGENPIFWAIGEWFYYRIRKPIGDWFRSDFNYFLCKLLKFYIKIISFNKLKVEIKDLRKICFSPKVRVRITYPQNASDDYIYKWYCRLPNHIWGIDKFVDIEHCEFGSDRGFYYPE